MLIKIQLFVILMEEFAHLKKSEPICAFSIMLVLVV